MPEMHAQMTGDRSGLSLNTKLVSTRSSKVFYSCISFCV